MELRRSDRPLAVATFFVLLVAGCTSPEDGITTDQGPRDLTGVDEIAFDPTTGAIVGIVVDDQGLPVAGATVILDGDLRALTNASGGFAFGFLEPATHSLVVAMDGYQAWRGAVDVVAGEATSIAPTLTRLANVGAYTETLTMTGFDSCSLAWRVPVAGDDNYTIFNYGVNCYVFLIANQVVGVGEDSTFLHYPPVDLSDVVGMWGETVWDSSQLLGSERWTLWGYVGLEVGDGGGTIINFATSEGESPLPQRIPIEDLVQTLAAEPADDCTLENCSIVTSHFASASDQGVLPLETGIGFSIQQRYDEYLTLFHKGTLPDEFTVLPDA